MTKDANPQAAHYDALLSDYDAHYFDAWSVRYRDRFMFRPLTAGLAARPERVADVCAGSGFNTVHLRGLFPAAAFFGLDVSAAACAAYQARTGCPAYRIDLTDPAAALPGPVDLAVVIGGLHHCVNDLPAALGNLAALVRPGGSLLLVEPNADFVLNGVRAWWYRRDRYFDAESERALDHGELAAAAAPYFAVEQIRFLGGPGYFVVLNSLILRLPRWAKDLVAPLFIHIDRAYNRLPGRRLFPYFVARWRRTDQAARRISTSPAATSTAPATNATDTRSPSSQTAPSGTSTNDRLRNG